MLTYDDQGRAYWDGERVPRTTEICALLAPRWQADEYYLRKGTLVHRIIEWDESGELDERTVDPELQGYLDAYRKFKSESGWIYLNRETRFFHPKYRYCGRVDAHGFFKSQCSKPPWGWVVDFKTGQPHEADTLQAPAYLFGVKYHNASLIHKCADLYLKKDGSYQFAEVKNPTYKFLKFLEGVKQWQTEQKLK